MKQKTRELKEDKPKSNKVSMFSYDTFIDLEKDVNPYTGLVSGNYWSQTGMPWVSSDGRKAVRIGLL